ncbi:hypothetical protein EBR96_07725, partial [bacterium]|nr:hypothetical protein [bacterium]
MFMVVFAMGLSSLGKIDAVPLGLTDIPYIRTWAEHGGPNNVVVDASHNIYVIHAIDGYMISKYDAEGNKIKDFAPQGSGDGEINISSGMGISPDGYLYVTDEQNNR